MNREKLVLMAALQGRLSEEQISILDEAQFTDSSCRALFRLIRNDLAPGEPIDSAVLSTQLRGEAELTLLSELSLTDDLDDRNLQRLHENLIPMQADHIARRKQQLQREITDALQQGDDARVSELLREKTELSKVLEKLK